MVSIMPCRKKKLHPAGTPMSDLAGAKSTEPLQAARSSSGTARTSSGAAAALDTCGSSPEGARSGSLAQAVGTPGLIVALGGPGGQLRHLASGSSGGRLLRQGSSGERLMVQRTVSSDTGDSLSSPHQSNHAGSMAAIAQIISVGLHSP